MVGRVNSPAMGCGKNIIYYILAEHKYARLSSVIIIRTHQTPQAPAHAEGNYSQSHSAVPLVGTRKKSEHVSRAVHSTNTPK